MTVVKKLLVVESPTKAKTIGKYLGSEYSVVATVGHLRDLPESKMGVDLKNFDVDYQISKDKKEIVVKLISEAIKADQIILASDPDREGEAISWHVKWLLENSKKPVDSKKISRATFHEITKGAIEEALKTPREIDMNLVDAQQGRRVLDRVVGYTLSPVLWKKVRRGLSAGRVQSVAVRLICEREKEINAFVKEKFFKVIGNVGFVTILDKIDGKSVTKLTKIKLFDGEYSYSKSIFKNREEVEGFVKGLDDKFVVDKVDDREVSRTPLPAFTTSKMQQMAARRMGWSGKQTMSTAQRLYEKGLITYHRTDSVYLSDKAIAEFRDFIEKKYGKEYVAEKVRVYKNNSKNAQEAHEAIRPTNVAMLEPTDVDARELKLYQIIWRRAVATQAAAARMKNTTVVLSNKNGLFKSTGVTMLFEGFLKISMEKHEDQLLPMLEVGKTLKSRHGGQAKGLKVEETETNPPPRYTDASLVGSLEKQGIGRPSTYAPIISTIQARQYVEKEEGKYQPTALGNAANEFLVKNFEDILSLPFTAGMEENLDKIALGKMAWKKMMKDFYSDFEKEVKNVEATAERVKVEVEKTGEKCPDCNEGDLVIRVGKFGKFVSCSRFPDCKYTAQFKEEAGFACPLCGKEGVVRRTKTGRRFYGCSDYPNCKWAGWKKPIDEKK